jgi:hypothetical protein
VIPQVDELPSTPIPLLRPEPTLQETAAGSILVTQTMMIMRIMVEVVVSKERVLE